MSDADGTVTSEEGAVDVAPVEVPVTATDQPESQEIPAPAEELAPEPPAAADPAVSPDAELFVESATTTDASPAGLTWVPFAVYLTGWVALATATGYLLRGATAESPARWMPEYPILLWVGVGLVAAGPVVSLIVWLAARGRREAPARRGLLASSMLRGALMAVLGVAMWLGVLYTIEVVTVNGALG